MFGTATGFEFYIDLERMELVETKKVKGDANLEISKITRIKTTVTKTVSEIEDLAEEEIEKQRILTEQETERKRALDAEREQQRVEALRVQKEEEERARLAAEKEAADAAIAKKLLDRLDKLIAAQKKSDHYAQKLSKSAAAESKPASLF